MQGGCRLYDAQFRRYQELERLQREGYTHAKTWGGKPRLITTWLRETQFKAGGVVGFFDRLNAATSD